MNLSSHPIRSLALAALVTMFSTAALAASTAPVLTAPANGSLTNDATPSYAGSAPGLAMVRVYVDGSEVGSTTAAADGQWSVTPAAALGDGIHSAWATAQEAGNPESDPSNMNNFRVDATPPAKPAVTSPAAGLSNVANPSFMGSAEAESTVKLFVDGGQITATVADNGGGWIVSHPATFADGTHSAYVIATDAAGNDSVQSDPVVFSIDATPPAVPVITSPAGGYRKVATLSFAGTGEIGSMVSLYDGGIKVGAAVVDGAGAWSIASLEFGDGGHSFRAKAEDDLGNTSAFSNLVSITIDTVVPPAPMLEVPANGTLTNDSTPMFSGTAEANSSVGIQIGNRAQATMANGGGVWSMTWDVPLAEGQYTVSATSVDAAGNVSPASNSRTFTLDLTPPAAPSVSTPSPGQAFATTTPQFGGTAEVDATVMLLVDGVPFASATAGAGGAWSATVFSPLAQGSHSLRAYATDAAGNEGAQSNAIAFSVDTIAPAAPVIASPSNGSSTASRQPQISGTAETNSTVTVSVDGNAIGSTTAAGGTWTINPSSLAIGAHTIAATASDAAGNTSPAATNNFTILGTATAQSTISASPSSVIANNVTTTTITVQARDTDGAALLTGGATVVLQTTRGTLSGVTDNANGTYTATLRSSTTGSATVTGTINSIAIADDAVVTFTSGAASASTSTIGAAASRLTANGTSTTTVTVQLKDANGNNVTTTSDAVTIASSRGTLSTPSFASNGAWTATLTAPTIPGTATLTATVNGATLSSTTTVTFVERARGDFTGDGKPDILLRNYSTGSNAIWRMNGTSLAGISDLPAVPNTSLRFDGTGDFTGDGQPDILLRNYSTGASAIWVMNGTSFTNIIDLPTVTNTNIHFEGTGDFNADGKTDILIRNVLTGANAVWLMNGTSFAGIADLPALVNTNLAFESCGDFNGDGKSDIVLRNYSTGANAIWLMNGTSFASIVDLPALPNTNFHFDGVADFDLDGKADIVLRNYATGANAVWLMNGTSLKGIVDLPYLGSLNMEINGPR